MTRDPRITIAASTLVVGRAAASPAPRPREFLAEGMRRRVPDRWKHRPPAAWFRATVFVAAVALLVVGLRAHAMWLDEIQAWLIVRDSHSVVEVVRNLAYEGHPALWYLLLYPLTALGRQPEWMQLVQAMCAIGSIALIVWRGPFSRLEVLLFPFGYCLLFEYGVKSRSYSLGTLLLMAFCALYPQRHRRPLLIATVLALLANVHVLFTIVAIVAMATILVDQEPWKSPSRLFTPINGLACTIVLFGLCAAAATALPPADSGAAVGWNGDLSLKRIGTTLRTLSGFTLEGGDFSTSIVPAVFGAVLIGIALARWRENRAAAFFLGTSSLGLLIFFHLKDLPHPWHHGVFFVVLIASVWIGRLHDPARVAPGVLPRSIFAIVLGMQAIHGIASLAAASVQPYANGRAVARFIESHGWAGAPTFALNDTASVSALGYLGADRFYYARGGRWGSFIVWDRRRLEPVDDEAFFALAREAVPAATVLDCGPAVERTMRPSREFVAVATIDGSATGEDCTIYRRPD